MKSNESHKIVKDAMAKIKLLERLNELLYRRIEQLEKHSPKIEKKIEEAYNRMERSYCEEIASIEKKLKRNYTKPERLNKYRSIIKEIVNAESMGHKPNIQKICDKIRGEDIWDLRRAFDRWKKRHPQDYSRIKKDIEAKTEHLKVVM